MGATVAFTDLGSLAGAGLPNISDLADQQLYLEPEISSEYCFEDIVGRSPLCRKCWNKWRSWPPPTPPSCFMEKRERERS